MIMSPPPSSHMGESRFASVLPFHITVPSLHQSPHIIRVTPHTSVPLFTLEQPHHIRVPPLRCSQPITSKFSFHSRVPHQISFLYYIRAPLYFGIPITSVSNLHIRIPNHIGVPYYIRAPLYSRAPSSHQSPHHISVSLFTSDLLHDIREKNKHVVEYIKLKGVPPRKILKKILF